MADLAYVFHFQPSELWAMEAEELTMWHAQAIRIGREREPTH